MDEFLKKFGKELTEYLESEKVFIPNPERFSEVIAAKETAEKLFTDFEITVDNDSLQTGALVIKMAGGYIECSGTEVKEFQELISKADNFEIFSNGKGLKANIMFYGALKRI